MSTTLGFYLIVGLLAFSILCSVVGARIQPLAKTFSAPLDVPRMKRIIKLVENWDGQTPGFAGELGAMQFKESTWGQYSSKPFYWARAKGPQAAAECVLVEEKHVRRLIHYCQVLRREVTAYNIALLHNAGFGNVERGLIAASELDFAERCQNLYDERR